MNECELERSVARQYYDENATAKLLSGITRVTARKLDRFMIETNPEDFTSGMANSFFDHMAHDRKETWPNEDDGYRDYMLVRRFVATYLQNESIPKEKRDLFQKQLRATLFAWRHLRFPHNKAIHGGLVIGGGVWSYEFNPDGNVIDFRTLTGKGHKYHARVANKLSPTLTASTHELETLEGLNITGETEGRPWRIIGDGSYRDEETGEIQRRTQGAFTDSQMYAIANYERQKFQRSMDVGPRAGQASEGFWMWVHRNGDKSRILQMHAHDLHGDLLELFLKKYQKFYDYIGAEGHAIWPHPSVVRAGKISKKDRKTDGVPVGFDPWKNQSNADLVELSRKRSEFLWRWRYGMEAWGSGTWFLKAGRKLKDQDKWMAPFMQSAEHFKRSSKLSTPGIRFADPFKYTLLDDFSDPKLADGAAFYTQGTLGSQLTEFMSDFGWYQKDKTFLAKGMMVGNDSEDSEIDEGFYSRGNLIMVKPMFYDVDELLRQADRDGDKERYATYQGIRKIIQATNSVVMMGSSAKALGGANVGRAPIKYFKTPQDFKTGVVDQTLLDNKEELAKITYKWGGTDKNGKPKRQAIYFTMDPNTTQEWRNQNILKQLLNIRFNMSQEDLDAMLRAERKLHFMRQAQMRDKNLDDLVPYGQDAGEYDPRRFGTLQYRLEAGEKEFSLVHGVGIRGRAAMASALHKATAKKFSTVVIFTAAPPDPKMRDVQFVNGQMIPMEMHANFRGVYAEDRPEGFEDGFDSVEQATKWLNDNWETARNIYPWMYDVETDAQGDLYLGRNVRAFQIQQIQDKPGKFEFIGQVVLDNRVPLSEQNYSTVAHLSRRISRSRQEERTSAAVGFTKHRDQARKNADLKFGHSLKLEDAGKFEINSNSTTGLNNLIFLHMVQAFQRDMRARENMQRITNINDPKIVAMVEAARRKALEDSESPDSQWSTDNDLSPVTLRGSIEATRNARSKDVLKVMAGNASALRLLERLRSAMKPQSGDEGTFADLPVRYMGVDGNQVKSVLRMQRSQTMLDAMTEEQRLMRDHTYLGMMMSMAVDDEKDPKLGLLNLNKETAPLLVALAYLSPVFNNLDKAMDHMVSIISFLGHPMVRSYATMMQGRALGAMYGQHQVLKALAASLRDMPAGDERAHSERVVKLMRQLFKISDDIGYIRSLLNARSSWLSQPERALNVKRLLARMIDNAFNRVDTARFKKDGELRLEVTDIHDMIMLQISSAWADDPLFLREREMDDYERDKPFRRLGDFAWQNKAKQVRERVVRETYQRAAVEYLGEEGVSVGQLAARVMDLKDKYKDNKFIQAIEKFDIRGGLLGLSGKNRFANVGEPLWHKFRDAFRALDMADQKLITAYGFLARPNEFEQQPGSWNHITDSVPPGIELNACAAKHMQSKIPTNDTSRGCCLLEEQEIRPQQG